MDEKGIETVDHLICPHCFHDYGEDSLLLWKDNLIGVRKEKCRECKQDFEIKYVAYIHFSTQKEG